MEDDVIASVSGTDLASVELVGTGSVAVVSAVSRITVRRWCVTFDGYI